MKLDQTIAQRLDELVAQGEAVLQTKHGGPSAGPGFISLAPFAVKPDMAYQWGVSCLSLLGRVFGQASDHYTKFDALFPKIDDHPQALRALGVLRAPNEDYQRGYLFDTRTLIQAEVFDDFLEQAAYLLSGGYEGPAAVIAGSVLEDGLRKLCVRSGMVIPSRPKLDTMNADLAKQGVYNLLVQKRITALADLRNKAAHGQWSEFDKADVGQMIDQVRTFMEAHFS